MILHYEDWHKPSGRHETQKHLQQLCPEYDASGSKSVDAARIIKRIEEAEVRAAVNLQRRAEEGKPFGAPSTTVHLLTGAIRGNA